MFLILRFWEDCDVIASQPKFHSYISLSRLQRVRSFSACWTIVTVASWQKLLNPNWTISFCRGSLVDSKRIWTQLFASCPIKSRNQSTDCLKFVTFPPFLVTICGKLSHIFEMGIFWQSYAQSYWDTSYVRGQSSCGDCETIRSSAVEISLSP